MIRSGRRPRRKDDFADIVNPVQRLWVRILAGLDITIYTLVGLAFIGAALLALGYSIWNLIDSLIVSFQGTINVSNFATNVLNFVSDLLLVLIIMEVLGTIRSYLAKGDTSVKPFLFIGIISATRGILSIGAELSVNQTISPDEFLRKMIELGVDAVIIVALGATIRILGDLAINKDDESPSTDGGNVATPASPS